MKRIYALALVLLFLFYFAGCTGNEKTRYIPDDYTSWRRVNDVELDYPIPGHESNYRIIYMNVGGFDVEVTEEGGERRYSYPEGTIIAKSVYEGLEPPDDAEPVMITAMVKDSGHMNARGGWVWVVKNLSSGEEEIIEGQFCFTCHAAANESHPYADGNPEEEFRDYVFFSDE